MYAIIRTGGKQLKVQEGERVKVEKLLGAAGDPITVGDVLSVHDGEKSRIGRPIVEGAKVQATIVGQGRGPKIRIHKFKKRKGYAKTMGHRQDFTELKIDKIICGT